MRADGADELVRASGNPILALARSLVSNRVCLATEVAGDLDVRWVATDGIEEPIAVLVGLGDNTVSVSTTFDATREICWITAAESPVTRLVGWDDAGTKIHDQSINFLVFPWSSLATEPDVLWIAGLDSSFAGVVSELRWSPTTGGEILSRQDHPYTYQYFIRP